MNLRHFLVDTYVHMPPPQILIDVSDADAMRRLSPDMHTIAEVVAHMDFWQAWFLKRCRGEATAIAANAALGWPAVSDGEWPRVRERFLNGLSAAVDVADNPERLTAPVEPAIELPALAEYSVSEALVHVAGHNSHHLGQIITLRQMMGIWPPSSGSFTW